MTNPDYTFSFEVWDEFYKRNSCSKHTEGIFKETLKQSITHLPKCIQTDSGGKNTHFQKLIGSMIETITEEVKTNGPEQALEKAAEHYYAIEDRRLKMLRLQMNRRRANILAKHSNWNYEKYKERLVKMNNKTIDDANKRSDRTTHSDKTIIKELLKIQQELNQPQEPADPTEHPQHF